MKLDDTRLRRRLPKGTLAEGALALRFRGVTLGSEILQTLCRGLQDFTRKLLVRYGASHTDRTDQRAILIAVTSEASRIAFIVVIDSGVPWPLA